MASSDNRILIYAIGSLGDNIVSIPALRTIRAYYGADATICLLHDLQDSGRVTSEAVLGATGLVNRFISYQFSRSRLRKLATAIRLCLELRSLRFNAVVSLLPSERSAQSLARDAFFFRICGIPAQIGFDAISDNDLYPRDEHGFLLRTLNESTFRLRRLANSGLPVTETEAYKLPLLSVPAHEQLTVDNWLRTHRRQPDRKLVAICPGCKQPAHSWNLTNFLEIGSRLAARKEFELIVVGGPAEQNAAAELTRAWGEGLVAAGQFSVMGSAAVLARCDFTVGLDTGTTHLAAAVGTPCIVAQGARSTPGMWEPLGDTHTVIRKRVACEGCLQTTCPKPDHPCMNGISVEEVWSAIEMQLRRAA